MREPLKSLRFGNEQGGRLVQENSAKPCRTPHTPECQREVCMHLTVHRDPQLLTHILILSHFLSVLSFCLFVDPHLRIFFHGFFLERVVGSEERPRERETSM